MFSSANYAVLRKQPQKYDTELFFQMVFCAVGGEGGGAVT